MKTKTSRSKKVETPKVDWESLAKRLQTALASEIKEHEETEAARKHDQKTIDKLVNLSIRLEGIIQYLESKLGNNPV